MTNKKYIALQNAKARKEKEVEYYELLLYYKNSLEEKKVVNNFASYRGEFDRMNKYCKENSSYRLEVNLYDYNKNFEKRIY